MKLIYEDGYSETTDGHELSGKVLTVELWRFCVSIWLTRVKR